MDMTDQRTGLSEGEDGKLRCAWHGNDPLYRSYHDDEWGRPVTDDRRLYEKICLEGFQSGLSWLTILRKRENFRAAFADFDFAKVADFGEAEIARLLGETGIIRHRGKIVSTINNARRAGELVAEAGSLARFFWSFEPEPGERPGRIDWATLASMPTTDASTRLSKELKKRGWSFVGPTTVYAFMQAVGLVNDHLEDCFCRAEVEGERRRFKRPR
jgi:DNA-3-methyladenine glycosylase I